MSSWMKNNDFRRTILKLYSGLFQANDWTYVSAYVASYHRNLTSVNDERTILKLINDT